MRIDAPLQLALGFALFCGSALLGIALLRRERRVARLTESA
jgi:ABC-type transport system involved in cytochrome c biogenesis permease subunit